MVRVQDTLGQLMSSVTRPGRMTGFGNLMLVGLGESKGWCESGPWGPVVVLGRVHLRDRGRTPQVGSTLLDRLLSGDQTS